MAIEIRDGKGTGNRSKVSGNRLFTHSVVETEAIHATAVGDSYNINTGSVSLTSTTASGILYVKNNENRDLVIEAVACGLGNAGTVSDVASIVLVRNPTGGTLISNATAVSMNQNRNFGSSKTLTINAYKGAEGSTVTGGNDIAQFFAAAGSRLFAEVNMILTKGDSIAVKIDTNTTLGTTNVYAAILCHLKDNDFLD